MSATTFATWTRARRPASTKEKFLAEQREIIDREAAARPRTYEGYLLHGLM
jgi:hypothetical protein